MLVLVALKDIACGLRHDMFTLWCLIETASFPKDQIPSHIKVCTFWGVQLHV